MARADRADLAESLQPEQGLRGAADRAAREVSWHHFAKTEGVMTGKL